MFLNQTASGGRAVAPVPTHSPVRTHRVQERPPRSPRRSQAALLRSAEAFLKNIPNGIFKQHFAMAHFKCNHRNLHTLNYFGGKELNTRGPRPLGGQPQA